MSKVDRMTEDMAKCVCNLDTEGWMQLPRLVRASIAANAADALRSLGFSLETLAALKAGTWKAVPVEPTDAMGRPLTRLWLMADQEPTGEDMQCAREYAAAIIAAAPSKPGDGE